MHERDRFRLQSTFTPSGDQPQAIAELTAALAAGEEQQVLLGATGTGKTFTIANVIEKWQRPTLVMAPNKTLAAQLYSEFKEIFGANAVEYFVSYYDYYQPEAYIPSTDTFIEKDSMINDAIDRMRHSATRSLFERNDVIIVASVSCIYGLGTSEAYAKMLIQLEEGMEIRRKKLLQRLVENQYERKDIDFHRGSFRVRGDIVEVFPTYEEELAIRIEFFGDEIEALWEIDPLRGKKLRQISKIAIYPNTHYAVLPERRKSAIDTIHSELQDRLDYYVSQGKLLEAQRLQQRTQHDLEMMISMGYCNGIENYSRHLSGRSQGDPPPTLLDYFPAGFLTVVDESHVTIPQIGGMFRGDRSRKEVLVEHGFRLPSALDNRPLTFDEWRARVGQLIHVSATPGDWELEQTSGVIVEQIIRPTGLLDPHVELRPALDQVDDVYGEIRKRVDAGERVLVTTLTKRMSEDLTEYLQELGIKVRYLHSEIKTIERMNILRDLRIGLFDVLVGINLLREGIDVPEVSLVAILDADKEGFLRSTRSLIQTIGRAARNVNGTVILYADNVTGSIREAMSETNRRRAIQLAYNEEHGITPKTVSKKIFDLEHHLPEASKAEQEIRALAETPPEEAAATIVQLREKMQAASSDLRFEDAARFRDEIRRLEQVMLGIKPS